jgi:hypothetical protein
MDDVPGHWYENLTTGEEPHSMPVITEIADLKRIYKRRVPKMFYDYAETGSAGPNRPSARTPRISTRSISASASRWT